MGFFDDDDIPSSRGDERPVFRAAAPELGCGICKLRSTCLSPMMTIKGQGKLKILVVVERPSKDDDEQENWLSGPGGRAVRDLMKSVGIDPVRDIWVTGALQCRTEQSADPVSIQIGSCHSRLMETIEQVQPKVIIAMGRWAMEGLKYGKLVNRLAGLSSFDWQGVTIPDQDLKTWIQCTWSISDIEYRTNRRGIDPVVESQLMTAFKNAKQLLDVPVPVAPGPDRVLRLYNKDQIAAELRGFIDRGNAIAFDYETTGRKPYRAVQRIVAVSVSDGDKTIAFPYNEAVAGVWAKFLNSDVPKVAHNAKFEYLWGLVKCNSPTVRVVWDTLLAAHNENNRRATNLKFCTYCELGVLGYDNDVDPYLETTKAEEERYGANGMNMVASYPIDNLLVYNGLDSLYTIMLYRIQYGRMSKHQIDGVRWFTRASTRLARAEARGIRIEGADADVVRAELTAQMKSIEAQVRRLPIMEKWDRVVGSEYRLSAPADLTKMLFTVMGLQSKSFTASGAPAGDKAAMEDYMDQPIVALTMEWRGLQKTRDTFVKGFVKEAVNGRVNPFFGLGGVDTFRSSSDSPNFQNIPKRDKKKSKPIRRLLRPSKGFRLAEYDYKAVEVCVSACVNLDPTLIRYIEDPSSDMHRDMGCQIFMKTPDELTKDDRSVAKNGFVFPEFYGSYYEQVAPDLWFKMAPTTRDHLGRCGIKTLDAFTAHIADIEDQFWNERFAVYNKWRKDTVKQYEERGYIEQYTGFRCQGPMKRNEVINYPVQGPAFHVLLWTFMNVSEEMERRGMESAPIGQIHDAAIMDIAPHEEMWVDRLMWEFGTVKVREHWPWIVVPLTIEKERSAIDGSWAEMEACGHLTAPADMPGH